MLRFIIGLAALVAALNAQMVRQCLCSEVNTCANSAATSINQCADRCQAHFTALGANYAAARQCIVAHQGQITAAANCARSSFGNICANAPGATVPKRYPETVQIAAFREVQGMIARSGLTAQAQALMGPARKIGGCLAKCAQANSCAKLGCGLALPADNILVSTAKRCAISAGFNTPVAREICNCLANAGVSILRPMCDHIVIS
ncbi:hypothetical protein PRIPAC_70247 [Pristionchus pacificus]|nr:hypothetical protein PRIPAC_70247 [Pristionchus pacificus]